MSRTDGGIPVWAVVPAAGQGKRFGDGPPKQYSRLAGRALIEHTLATLLAEPRVAGVVVALADDDAHWQQLDVAADSRVRTVTGGAERHLSVLRALAVVPGAGDPWVAVHDAARPCLAAADLARLLDALGESGDGCILATPATDTLKQVNETGQIMHTLDRIGVWQAQTPQVFRRGQLLAALQASETEGAGPTDEAAAMERAGACVQVIAARALNPKITTRMDLQLAEALLQQ